MDNKSHILKHLHSITTYLDSYNYLSFKITDKAKSRFDSKSKEALHINWRKSNLNTQQNHLAVFIACITTFILSVFVFFSFVFLFHLSF